MSTSLVIVDKKLFDKKKVLGMDYLGKYLAKYYYYYERKLL